MTYHKDKEPLTFANQSAHLTDFVEPDTAYAIVIQAVNSDGPGPYSEQHTIRTMSRGLVNIKKMNDCFYNFTFTIQVSHLSDLII